MISGQVNEFLEAVVPITIRDVHGHEHVIDAIVDTGFSGSLTLPPQTITQLVLPWRSRGSAMLADGSFDQFDNHTAIVTWNGQAVEILVEAVAIEPLIEMRLLAGHELRLQAIANGAVEISPIES